MGQILNLDFSGDFVDRVTPVPIPNTEVKPVGADGTARVTAWESRKSPGLFKEARSVKSKRASAFLRALIRRVASRRDYMRKPAWIIFERALLITKETHRDL